VYNTYPSYQAPTQAEMAITVVDSIVLIW